MSQEKQTRREFFLHACQAASVIAIGGALGTILQGCSSDDNPAAPGSQGGLPTINATEANGRIVLTIGTDSPLAAVGKAAQVQYQGGTLLVAHTAQSAFTALTAICTHEGCTISGYSNNIYTCPCHGSQFNTNGQVSRGPAGTPLRQYQTQFDNGILTITL